ncbi:hypothetical protein DW272_02380 [Blautia obeum]|uniref:Uncharacterized protein n=1 Tax=Blautia obeum TaxID=40520 RepID=A0A414SKG2_9FIRM|nr:hypothetical protein [Blautia obeum]RHG20073.1 hypothetical protein DW272_02380 [Blautia obeum]
MTKIVMDMVELVLLMPKDWAELLENKIKSSTEDPMKVVIDNADKLSNDTDTEGITGFMYSFAVSILSQCWKYGEYLRKWHNQEYSYDGMGVVNPAAMSLKLK